MSLSVWNWLIEGGVIVVITPVMFLASLSRERVENFAEAEARMQFLLALHTDRRRHRYYYHRPSPPTGLPPCEPRRWLPFTYPMLSDRAYPDSMCDEPFSRKRPLQRTIYIPGNDSICSQVKAPKPTRRRDESSAEDVLRRKEMVTC